ncbi:ABC transporter ATP-binding protein [Devosia sp.]|uniref:ABC transporter ATP-binding protein n=1 Tax=Devosia sp. TaxID=1871048 RepID=UPI003A910639
MIEAEAITVTRGRRRLLDGVSLSVSAGELLGVVGPNGSGKTTLLRALYGAVVADGGSVRLDGDELVRLNRRAIARRIAVVPQGQTLDPDQTVSDMVALGRLPRQSWFGARRQSDDTEIAEAIGRVGLAALAAAPLRRLSGGELQRALIARALCQQADHLLLDEPTNHLDLAYQHDVLHLVRQLHLATLVVLHDLNLAARYCDRVALIDGGRLVAVGPPDSVLTPEQVSRTYKLPTDRIMTPAGRPHLVFADSPQPPECHP